MISRSLRRTLRQRQPSNLSTTCSQCICRCGATIPPSSASLQRRNYASPAPERLVGKRGARNNGGPLTPAQARVQKARYDEWFRWHRDQLGKLSRLGLIHTTGENALKFLSAFEKLLDKFPGQTSVPPEPFLKLLQEYSILVQDAEQISRVLLRDDVAKNTYRGKKLLYSLSRAGSESATIRVMAHAYLEAERKLSVLKVREIAVSREHLTKIANQEVGQGNFRAMVLEGKIALRLGNEEYAIKMFRKAMAAAVLDSERKLANPLTKERDFESDILELTSPWVELMETHLHRSKYKGLDEWKDFEWAMEIGCEQDDPLAHKFAADYCKRLVMDGEQEVHIGTSEWLYHITKAAASNIPAAMHDLGIFYSESGWKYIEDEPPDHVKPTPFDSYPASKPLTTFWNTLHLFGLKKKRHTPQERMFHGAAFPHTAVERQKAAIGWLNQAMTMNYAPSYLYIARLYNRKTLWAPANAPKDALEFKESRYTFASKKDFEANHPISSEPQAEEEEEEDPPNPLYDPEKAKKHLCEVFSAYEAHLWAEERMRIYEGNLKRGEGTRFADDGQVLEEAVLRKEGLPAKLGKWFKFPEVRMMNAKSIKRDYEEAKGMCEEEGWVLVDEEGGLVYKPGMKEKPFWLAARKREE